MEHPRIFRKNRAYIVGDTRLHEHTTIMFDDENQR